MMETLDVLYRPQTLDEVVGDETLIEGIKSMLGKANREPSTYDLAVR